MSNIKTIKYTYKFRIYPSVDQIHRLSMSFGCVRYVYNYFLNKEQESYKKNKKHLGYYSNAKALTELKKEKDWLKECNSQSLQHSLKHLERAYTNFFEKRGELPRFKSKKSHYDSITIPQFCTIDDKYIYFPKFKQGIRCKFHRLVEGTIKNFTISRTPSNQYYVSIQVEKEVEAVHKTNKSIGIDLGIESLLTLSDGTTIENNHYIDKYSKKLAKAQRHLSRKKVGSNSYNRQRMKVARLQEKISNSRKDYLHKITSNLIKQYDTICIEDLDNKNMKSRDLRPNEYRKQRSSLNRNLSDVSFGLFKSFLTYKSDWNNKQLIKVNKYYPSSKLCHICGYKKTDLTLNDRVWTCPICHTTHNRDYNAAINILNEGIRLNSLSLGTNDYTDGATQLSSTIVSESIFTYYDDVALKSEAINSLD